MFLRSSSVHGFHSQDHLMVQDGCSTSAFLSVFQISISLSLRTLTGRASTQNDNNCCVIDPGGSEQVRVAQDGHWQGPSRWGCISAPHSRLTQGQGTDRVMPSTITSMLFCLCGVQAFIHSSSKWFLSPSHVSGTLSRMADDTCKPDAAGLDQISTSKVTLGSAQHAAGFFPIPSELAS